MPCYECQCNVTIQDVNRALQPAEIILAPGDELGTSEGGDIILIPLDDFEVHFDQGLIIHVTPCIDCECSEANCTFTCNFEACTTPLTTTPGTTPPICWSTWSDWTSCLPSQCSMSTRNRTCQSTSSMCNCSSPQEDVKYCPCSTTTHPPTTTVCTRGCRNICEDTCHYFNSSDCVFTVPESNYINCTCKLCPDGYLEDNRGVCVRQEDCPCFHNGTYYPVGFNISYPEICQRCACDSRNVYSCSSLPGCCVLSEWTEWSNCSVGCGGGGTRSRRKIGLNGDCPEENVQTEACTGQCGCVINGTEYPVDSSEPECFKCTCVNGQCTTLRRLEPNSTWSEWGDWSLCLGDNNCRDFTRTRCRSCSNHSSCGPSDCDGPAVEEEPCNSDPCCTIFQWSAWGDCSVTCGSGSKERHKLFSDNATTEECRNTEIQEVGVCGNSDCSCDSIGDSQWTNWTECQQRSNASCGWGTHQRHRMVGECDGIPMLQQEDCFIDDCACEDGLVFSNHSTCHPVCNQPVDPLCHLTLQAECVCPMGTYYDLTSGACVTKEVCDRCTYNNHTYKPGDKWDCGECSICHCCSSGHVRNERKQCPNISACDLTTHKLVPSTSSCCSVDCVLEKCEVHVGPFINVTVSGCVSVFPVPNQYCYGECAPSGQGVNYILSKLAQRECTCCSANEFTYQNITLSCPDGTMLLHSIPKLKSCRCGLSVCA